MVALISIIFTFIVIIGLINFASGVYPAEATPPWRYYYKLEFVNFKVLKCELRARSILWPLFFVTHKVDDTQLTIEDNNNLVRYVALLVGWAEEKIESRKNFKQTNKKNKKEIKKLTKEAKKQAKEIKPFSIIRFKMGGKGSDQA